MPAETAEVGEVQKINKSGIQDYQVNIVRAKF